MTIDIYHQLGHFYKWNFESYDNDNVGDGFIIAASHMEKGKLEALTDLYKSTSIFDPQFFLPNIQIRKLMTYDFFPNAISNGFKTDSFTDSQSRECAKKCIQFQIDSNFNKLIIPTRHFTGLPISFIQQQSKLFVDPFLSAIKSSGVSTPVLLQLIVNESMVKSEEYAADILNWVTGIQGISGVYLISDINPRPKQILDIDFLYMYMHFINALRLNDLYVLLGFQNAESLILSIADPNAITIGSYENLRMFNIRNFENSLDQQRRSPNARIYVSKLIQWIDINYIGAIRRKFGDTLFDENYYHAIMFQPTYQWHFNKPELYKHYFLVFSKQMKEISGMAGADRHKFIISKLTESLQYFNLLKDAGIILDRNNDGSHLAPWMTAANQFAADQGWIS